jgi:hypothetical protein
VQLRLIASLLWIEYRLRVLLFFCAIIAVLPQSTSEHDINFESLSAETRQHKAATARFASA